MAPSSFPRSGASNQPRAIHRPRSDPDSAPSRDTKPQPLSPPEQRTLQQSDHLGGPIHEYTLAVNAHRLETPQVLHSLERQRSGPSLASKKPLVKGVIEF